MGVHIPTSRGHTKVWESISPSPGATRKAWQSMPDSRRHTKPRIPYHQLEEQQQSEGEHILESRGHTKA